jgi:Tol biopolymer transport system component
MKRALDRRGGRAILVLALALASWCLLPAAALAAFPGAAGKLAFVSARNGAPADNDLYTMNSDGTVQTRITSFSGDELYPSWSHDGTKIVFQQDPGLHPEIWVANAAGTGPQQLTSNAAADRHPAWNRNATRIAFASDRAGSGGRSDLFVMNANGSSQVNITNTPTVDEDYPSWSPDDMKIVFSRDGDIYTIKPDGTALTPLTQTTAIEIEPDWEPTGSHIVYRTWANVPEEIWKMNADGTAQTNLSNNGPTADERPSWSPAGDKIAWTRGAFNAAEVYVMNTNGTGQTAVTANTVADTLVAWQPLPPAGYPRPKGASPYHASIVVAYRKCTASNRMHGPPLAHPSCNPPQQMSNHLTVGSPDVNGSAANFIGSVRYIAIPGSPSTPEDDADVSLRITVTDVRRKSDLADYTGGLRAQASLRLTDKYNTDDAGGPAGIGTRYDSPYAVNVPCTPTTDTAIGSSCSIDTTADAVVPGTVREGDRSIWQLDQIRVYDGGGDGNPRTTSGNTLFAVQGVFVP